jgi:prepilin-type N-terminal cleavage/methylation domain-containing protein
MKKLFRSKHFSRLSNRHTLSISQINGFTLIELLIAAVLAPIIIVTVSNIFTSQVNSERRLIGAQSSENLRSRLSFLLESDIADGQEVLLPADSRCPSVTGALFSIWSPHLSNNTLAYACITYSESGDNLSRTGPAILQNGSLDYLADAVTQVVAEDVSLVLTQNAINPSGTQISFTMNLPSFIGAPARSHVVAYGTKNFRVGT